ncbi:MAG: HIT domain-containing protein [Spirochaetia bacterium]|nr:HIT domain-containing protein [Spirochaetia bacterium]
MPTLFTKIINREIPSSILYEDSLCIAILDINPVNKGHALVISKEEYPTTLQCPDEVLSHLIGISKRFDKLMRENLKAEATNIIINNGPAAGQEIAHLHIHIIPRYEGDRKKMILNKERYNNNEMDEFTRLLSL